MEMETREEAQRAGPPVARAGPTATGVPGAATWVVYVADPAGCFHRHGIPKWTNSWTRCGGQRASVFKGTRDMNMTAATSFTCPLARALPVSGQGPPTVTAEKVQ